MLSIPFSDWWCCLNPRERNTIKALIVAYLSNPEYVTQFTYLFISVGTGLAGLTQVNQYFINHYGLTDGVIFDIDGNPVPVYFFDTLLWTAFAAFAVSDNFNCTNPCIAFEFWN